MLTDYFQIAFKEAKRRKLRSFLTLVGIFIGIAAIISLITLGQGLENAISNQFSQLGKDKLFILPKGGFWGMGASVQLTENDLDTIKQASGTKVAAGLGFSYGRYEFNDLVQYNFVNGVPLDSEELKLVSEAQNWKLQEGRMLEAGDKYKIVLGNEYTKEDLFDTRVELGDKITIQNQDFKVVGFLEKIGSPPDDKAGIIPKEVHEEVFSTGKNYGFIIAQVQSGEEPTIVAEEMKKELRKKHDLDAGEEDFSIETPENLMATFSTILDIVQIVLIGITAISLLVGGIGIMNTMYTSVLQRTKEIGLMKAVGARNSQILFLFLIESGLYGLVGGLLGVVAGVSLAKIAEKVLQQFLGPAFMAIEINWFLVLGALLFSFLIGILSGIAPARRASKLNPVDSLRYE
ncbi:MAG TPA: ABC transporter permease [Candidatus Nanoarchaeia archaeon]|nr:ABC transporter permease [Candidatus Nanoarchaeia archaeon]